mmetsp:Transcript_124/g.209  ORF Transcript_124/g.209 Transcript_124/m.209 type:complete len:115 (+) Transcript_124:562-906(+)
MTVAAVTSLLSASTPMDSDEKTKIDVPDLPDVTAVNCRLFHECAASLSKSTTLSTLKSSLYDDRLDLEKGFFDCSSDIQEKTITTSTKTKRKIKQEDFSYTHVFLSTISRFWIG